jgi:hypothetical protein
MNHLVVFTIIMLVCLSLGSIGVGIYVSNFRSKPENKNKKFSVATVSLIMIVSLLLGLLVFGVYYMMTYEKELTCGEIQAKYSKCNPACPTCIWGPEDVANLKKAENTVHGLQSKARTIPRNMKFKAQCDDVSCVKDGRQCCGVDAEDIIMAKMTESLAVPAPAAKAPTGQGVPTGAFKKIPG